MIVVTQDTVLTDKKRVEVHKIRLEDSEYSGGFGYDEEFTPISFIGRTNVLRNVKIDLDEYEDGLAESRPTIWLQGWQW